MDRSFPRRFAVLFLPLAAVLSLAAALAFVVVQQDLRMGADDEPQRLAEDAVRALDAGTDPATVVGSSIVPIDASLSSFEMVFDAAGKLLASDGMIDGVPPTLPPGVLVAARDTGRDAVTWQPRPGIRIATVVMPWTGGTVVAGRSLRLVESHIDSLEGLVGVVLLVGIAALAALAVVLARVWEPRRT